MDNCRFVLYNNITNLWVNEAENQSEVSRLVSRSPFHSKENFDIRETPVLCYSWLGLYL